MPDVDQPRAGDDSSGGPRGVAQRMAEAARAWLDLLDERQRAVATGPSPAADTSDVERRRWFYTPTDHGGLTVHAQRPAQQQAAMRLVSTGLSIAGYVTVATIMGLENILDRTEEFRIRFDRERGRDPGLYYLRVFGEPGAHATWGWRFGGHHVSLNNLVVDGTLVATTPCFLGADPASSPLLGGATNRPLGAVEDIARDLVRSLPGSLRDRVQLTAKPPPDVVSANRSVIADGNRYLPLTDVWRDERFADDAAWAQLRGISDALDLAAGYDDHDHRAIEYSAIPRGVPAVEFGADQRQLLRSLLATYFGRVPDAVSPLLRYADDALLDDVHLAWAGSLEPGEPHYYRLQGPGLLIEWDNGQRNANHAHSVWRDPSGDFGLDVLSHHRRTHPHEQ